MSSNVQSPPSFSPRQPNAPGPAPGSQGGFMPPRPFEGGAGGRGTRYAPKKQGAPGKAQGLINALRNRSGQPGGIQSTY